MIEILSKEKFLKAVRRSEIKDGLNVVALLPTWSDVDLFFDWFMKTDLRYHDIRRSFDISAKHKRPFYIVLDNDNYVKVTALNDTDLNDDFFVVKLIDQRLPARDYLENTDTHLQIQEELMCGEVSEELDQYLKSLIIKPNSNT